MNIYTIYKATNKINGKSYIGFDSNYPKRKMEHKNSYSNGKEVFYFAIRKYGWDNFSWEILYQSKDSYYTKDIMENYFIVENRTYIHFDNSQGYNMTLGGDGTLGNKKTSKTKEKTKQTNLKIFGFEYASQSPIIKEKKKETALKNWGYEHPLQVPELIEKRKQTSIEKYNVDNPAKQKVNCRFCGKYCTIGHEIFCECNPERVIPYDRSGKNNPRYGIKVSEETKEKQRNKLCKKTYSITTPDGEIVVTNNLKKYCKDNNLDDRNMYKVGFGKANHHKGYVVKIIDDRTKSGEKTNV